MGKQLSLEERVTLGDEAKRLLAEGSMFNRILSEVTRDYIAALLTTNPGSQEAIACHSGLKALQHIKESVKVIENDAAVARKEIKKQG